MRKINAFIFVCCYLFISKMVFAKSSPTTVVSDGKTYECETREYNRIVCEKPGLIVLKSEDGSGWISLGKDPAGFIVSKPVQKITDGKNVNYQNNQPATPYEDTQFNRVEVASLAMKKLLASEDPLGKKYYAIAKETYDKRTSIEDKVKIVLNGSQQSYQCVLGKSRVLSMKQLDLQTKYNANFYCTFWSCTGNDPAEKVLLQMPKAAGGLTAPSVMVMKNGQAKFYKGDFKVYNNSPIPVTSVTRPYDEDEDPNLPAPDIRPELLIPSKYEASKSSYKYLLEMAKRDFQDEDGTIDMCTTPGKVQDLINERKKIAANIQKNLSEAELIEYLKIIDGRIQSFYVDRKKGLSLGCMYQDKIIDSSVLFEFDHLKEISTLTSTGKFLKPDEVQDLFKKAKNMKDIPFGYKYDGCYARAHIMSKRFEAMGIPTQKAWIKGSLFVPGTDIEWNYHVAPTVDVKEKNGKIVKYVIDPSLTDKAVPLDDWVAAMGKKSTGPIVKTTYPFPNNGLDFERTSVAISPSDVYGPQDLPGLTAEAKMEISKERLAAFTEVLASQGK